MKSLRAEKLHEDGINMDAKFLKYNAKCRFVHFRFRKDKDAKYLEFLDNLDNKTEFIRKAIDRELEREGNNHEV